MLWSTMPEAHVIQLGLCIGSEAVASEAQQCPACRAQIGPERVVMACAVVAMTPDRFSPLREKKATASQVTSGGVRKPTPPVGTPTRLPHELSAGAAPTMAAARSKAVAAHAKSRPFVAGLIGDTPSGSFARPVTIGRTSERPRTR